MSKRKKKRAAGPKAPNPSSGTGTVASNKPQTQATSQKSQAKTRNFLLDRRKLLLLGLGIPAASIGGVMIHRHDVRQKTEHDLSVIGQGEPVVVQVHDPGCSMCRRLMRNSREALEHSPDLLYRIADIKTTKGAAFQKRHGVPHVTLLLFNGEGKLQETLQGITPTNELVSAFGALSRPQS